MNRMAVTVGTIAGVESWHLPVKMDAEYTTMVLV